MNISTLTAVFPAKITFMAMLKFMGILAATVLVTGLLFRLILGRRSALNRAICAGIGVLCVYVLTIIVYTFTSGNLDHLLAPLPFIQFHNEALYMMTFGEAPFPTLCAEVLSLVILILIYNLADSLLPDGETNIGWLLLRGLTIILAMTVHYFLQLLTREFLPQLLVSYGPTILLVCLVLALLAGAAGALLGLVLTVVNPILGLLFHFFFSSKLGKQLSKAMLTTGMLLVGAVALTRLGYGVISISAIALLSYIPLFLVLIALWWLLERVF